MPHEINASVLSLGILEIVPEIAGMRVDLGLGAWVFNLVLVLVLVRSVRNFFLVLLPCMVEPVSFMDKLLAALGAFYNCAMMLVSRMCYKILIFPKLLLALVTRKLFSKGLHSL